MEHPDRQRIIDATRAEVAKLLKNRSPLPERRVTPILKSNSQSAFGSYIDVKRPSKAALEESPLSAPVFSSSNPDLLIQQLEALTSVITYQTVVIKTSFEKQQLLSQQRQQHITIEIGKAHRKIVTTNLWTFVLKIIFLMAIVTLLIFHIFHQRRW